MTVTISTQEFDLIRNYIETQCGIVVSDDKKYLIETRLARLLVETGSKTFGELYQKISTSNDATLKSKIVDSITTNETLWFRDSSPWVMVREQILPSFAQVIRANPAKRFRIWSAACSTGQEPYTVSMLIHDYCLTSSASPLSPDHFEIVATDISPSALFIAMAGRYDKISMKRGLDGDWGRFKSTYFKDLGRISAIADEIKKMVKFQKFNLQDSFAALGQFDLILMRNVAIYFSDSFKRNLFRRVADTLVPSGLLVLGSSESISGYSDRFANETHGRATIYRLSV